MSDDNNNGKMGLLVGLATLITALTGLMQALVGPEGISSLFNQQDSSSTPVEVPSPDSNASLPQSSNTPSSNSSNDGFSQTPNTPSSSIPDTEFPHTSNIPNSSSPIPIAIWRSESGKTIIPNLGSICQGNTQLNSVQTVFSSPTYSGNITFNNPKTGVCSPGDIVRGYFTLSSRANLCKGIITVTWKTHQNAYIEWDIDNLGSTCPVNTSHWEINTFPVKQ